MGRPNILIVNYNLGVIGGAETVTVNLANELATLNKYNVFLLSVNTTKRLIPYKLEPYIHYCQWKDIKCRLIVTIVKRKNKFLRYIKDNHISMIIFVSATVPFSLFIHSKSIKTIACDHSGLLNQRNAGFRYFILKWIESRACDKFVVLNDTLKDEFVRTFKIRKSKIEVIPNWIDCSISKEYDSTSKKIVSIGRLSAEKGYDLLCEVATILYSKHPDWQWDIYGDGPYREVLERIIEEKKLQKFVHLKGAVQNAANMLPQYSMLVLTSYRETFSLVILEAKAKSLPVISFDINSGPGYLIRNGIDGYLIPPYEVEDMVLKIESLIKSKELRIRMSRNAIGNIDKYQKNIIFSQWQRLIDTLLDPMEKAH